MAGDGVGVLELEGVVVRILTNGLVALFLGRDVGVVRVHTVIKLVLLLVTQGCGLGLKGVQTDFRDDLGVIVVRE